MPIGDVRSTLTRATMVVVVLAAVGFGYILGSSTGPAEESPAHTTTAMPTVNAVSDSTPVFVDTMSTEPTEAITPTPSPEPAAADTDQPQAVLGPQAPSPDRQGRTALGPVGVYEMRLDGFEEEWLSFDTGNSGDGCTNASCSVLFTWSVRDPYPIEGVAVEFLAQRQGAHASMSSANQGQAGKGYFDTASVVNRIAEPILIEVRFVLVAES